MTFWRSREAGAVKIVIAQLLPFFRRILSPGRIVWLVVVLPPREVLSVLDPDSTQYSTFSEHSFLTSTLTDEIGGSLGASRGALFEPKLEPLEREPLEPDPLGLGSLKLDPLEPGSLDPSSFEGSSEGDELGGGAPCGCASCSQGPQPERKSDAARNAQRAVFMGRIVVSHTDNVKASRRWSDRLQGAVDRNAQRWATP